MDLIDPKLVNDYDKQNTDNNTKNKNNNSGKRKMKQEEESKVKMSAKKRKALEKYIARKMKKDEGADLMKKLGQSSLQSSLLLSSKNFGSGGGLSTTKQKLKRALEMERAGLKVDFGDYGEVRLHQPVDHQSSEDESSDDEIAGEQVAVSAPKDLAVVEVKRAAFKLEIPAPTLAPIRKVEQEAAAAQQMVEKNPAFYVTVNRTDAIRASRLELPIVAEEQRIMEAISENSVIILSGETGSGKTTQVPQFLYEAGYGHAGSKNPGMIGITQPRRVAAVSMCQRVQQELNCDSKQVSYQIRYDGTVNPETKVKFMTDGVLLKEISNDFLLSKYSCVIIDEAHERSLNTDILIGLLSRIVVLRNNNDVRHKASQKVSHEIHPLKLIIMSATLRVNDFIDNQKLFSRPPPHVSIEARQFPVVVHFDRRTADNYVKAAVDKVSKIHERLPPGGILVFMTGQNEIEEVCKQLRKTFACSASSPSSLKGRLEAADRGRNEVQKSGQEAGGPMGEEDLIMNSFDEGFDDFPDEDVIVSGEENDEDDEEFYKGIESDELLGDKNAVQRLHICPLFAAMAPEEQMKAFEPAPPGTRLCVIATNIAETSITIPGIKYVVDSGRVKERVWDSNGVSAFRINWVSQASASQRTGRAGRTGPGHCYRLFSSALLHNQFDQFSKPEIERSPIDGIVLQMKDMNIDHVVNFPFVSPPSEYKLKRAERLLVILGALDERTKTATNMGRCMARLPVSPRLARVLMAGKDLNVLEYAITLVSALSVGDPFIRSMTNHKKSLDEDDEDMAELSEVEKSFRAVLWKFSEGLSSDLLRYVKVVGAWEFEKDKKAFCKSHFLQWKAMSEIRKLREQLVWMIKQMFSSSLADDSDLMSMKPMNDEVVAKLKLCLLYGSIDQVAIRDESTVSSSKKEPVAYKSAFRMTTNDSDLLYIHPTSSLATKNPKIIIFNELLESSTVSGKLRMKGVTEIRPEWITRAGSSLCSFSKPLEMPAPRYDPERDCIMCSVTPTFGNLAQIVLPVAEIRHGENAEYARMFLQNVLEGKVYKSLKKFAKEWITKPSIFSNKKIPVTHSKIFPLVHQITTKGLWTRQALTDEFERNPKFLLEDLVGWLPREKQNDLRSFWPPQK